MELVEYLGECTLFPSLCQLVILNPIILEFLTSPKIRYLFCYTNKAEEKLIIETTRPYLDMASLGCGWVLTKSFH